jgi:hypothetical protein
MSDEKIFSTLPESFNTIISGILQLNSLFAQAGMTEITNLNIYS